MKLSPAVSMQCKPATIIVKINVAHLCGQHSSIPKEPRPLTVPPVKIDCEEIPTALEGEFETCGSTASASSEDEGSSGPAGAVSVCSLSEGDDTIHPVPLLRFSFLLSLFYL
eukprot:TRINITY_DN16906_c0_g1_i1.p2 TRINITY_DN16906_c0_g1~~TRINITY_DN16906_c0_g1_i1.p2  ORF type:complete len:112 (+),score=5.38 TRINITY_DN16906_c0_g1_i1:412-747(+)